MPARPDTPSAFARPDPETEHEQPCHCCFDECTTGLLCWPSVLVVDDLRVTEGAQALARPAGLDVEQVAAQEVDVPVLERGEAGDVLVLDVVALGADGGCGRDGVR
jgi:hypothetical protein